ncbi:MAG TPA: VWA domain-containing protein [Actinomycetes bacterium]|jgi:Ca-activated chloride channel family protein
MTFLSPGRLWLLLAVAALAVVYVVMQRRRSKYAVRFTNLALLDKVAPTQPGWRRHLPAAAFLAMLGLLVVAFARPADNVRVPRERATVIVVLDVSASMLATDVEPDRITVAREAAEAFVDKLPAQFNVGLVAFSRAASVVVPPTTDRDVLTRGISSLNTGPGTAIGDGITTSLQAIAALDAQAAIDPPPARIVLLSDGANTAGRSPEVAAAAAGQAQVPVYTIAYGTDDGVVEINGEVIPVPADPQTLQEVADATGGRAYEAASGEELREVYEDIGSSVGYRLVKQDVTARYVGFGLIVAFAAATASLLWFSRLP